MFFKRNEFEKSDVIVNCKLEKEKKIIETLKEIKCNSEKLKISVFSDLQAF